MEPSCTQQSGIAGLQSTTQASALMGSLNSTTLLRAPASMLKNLRQKNTSIISGQGQINNKPRLYVPDVIPCRSRLDSTASQSMISTRDDASDVQSVMTSTCQKSINSFIKEPPQPHMDPCCRIMEPSCCECPEDDKVRSCVMIMPPSSKLLEIPPKAKSYEEPTKRQIPLIDPYVRNCMNCEGKFRLKTMRLGGKLCANCFKIHESVSRTVAQFGGSFNLVVKAPGQVELILSCSQGHTWKIGMQSRKAKNGCRQCKDDLRVENARRQFEEQAREREEQERQQRELLY
jgi:hypothetical protein